MIGDRIRQIRLDLEWSGEKMAAELGVSQETVSNWEAGRNKFPLERLLKMAEVTGFPASYILGEETVHPDWAKPLSREALAIMHRKPVWTRSQGWCLVNWAKQALIRVNGDAVPFGDITEDLFGIPPALSISVYGFGPPLKRDEIAARERVWLEPIGTDLDLNTQLRGWYKPHNGIFVANEIDIRFYLDTYGAKWLAFFEEL